jgi:hypothetical protein
MGTRADDPRLAPRFIGVRYNVPARAVDEPDAEFVSSENDVPELEYHEAEDAAKALERILNTYFSSHGFAEEDEFGDFQYGEDVALFSGWYVDEPVDRTVQTPLTDPAMYSVGLVRHVREEFLAVWPLWRIRVCSDTWYLPVDEAPRHDLMIYPDWLWAADRRCPPNDLAQTLHEWIEWHQSRREERLGPKRRQFRYAKFAGAKLFPALEQEPFALVAAFDNHESNPRRHAIWIVHQGPFYEYIVGEDDAAHGRKFALREDGTTHGGGLYEGEHCLCEWIVPAAESHRLTIQREKGESEWVNEDVIEISPEQIISDARLRELGYQ